MDRRDFLKTIGFGVGAGALASGSQSLLLVPTAAAAHHEGTSAALAPKSRAAFAGLLDALRDIERDYLSPKWNMTSARDVLDGHRFFMQILTAAIDFYVETDPERPHWTPIVSPTRKFGGGNPDAHYMIAAIRGDRRYRVRGRMNEEVYLSFTLHGGTEQVGWQQPVVGTLNFREIQFQDDGSSFELIISPSAADSGLAKNFLQLKPGYASIVTRHYFLKNPSAQLDPDLEISLEIEPLDDPGPASPLDEDETVRRLEAVKGFMRDLTLTTPAPSPETAPAWYSTTPNVSAKPGYWTNDREDGGGGWGAVDNAYMGSIYSIAADEALVITGRWPKCVFANVVLWNKHIQEYDYRYRTISYNKAQTKNEPDGSFRLVVAHEDPGVPNWLATEGRPTGIIYWRFQLPAEEPVQPRYELVKLSQLKP